MKNKIIDYLKGRQDGHSFRRDQLIEQRDRMLATGHNKDELRKIETNIEVEFKLVEELDHIIIVIRQGI